MVNEQKEWPWQKAGTLNQENDAWTTPESYFSGIKKNKLLDLFSG